MRARKGNAYESQVNKTPLAVLTRGKEQSRKTLGPSYNIVLSDGYGQNDHDEFE